MKKIIYKVKKGFSLFKFKYQRYLFITKLTIKDPILVKIQKKLWVSKLNVNF